MGSFFDIAGPDELPKFATRLGPLVAYSWTSDGRTINDLWIWHWCEHPLWEGRGKTEFEAHRDDYRFWSPAGVGAHDLITVDPLHIEASVYWPDCCGLHGWIRDGRWTDA